MSLSVQTVVTHKISLNIPEVVFRDAIAHMLMNYLREDLMHADLEDLLDDDDNQEVARSRLQDFTTRMILPFIEGEVYDELGRHVEISFSFNADLNR